MGNKSSKNLYIDINEFIQNKDDKMYIFLLKVKYKLILYLNNNNNILVNNNNNNNILVNNLSDFFGI